MFRLNEMKENIKINSHAIWVYKSYQRIIRQHLYINIKYFPMKTELHT